MDGRDEPSVDSKDREERIRARRQRIHEKLAAKESGAMTAIYAYTAPPPSFCCPRQRRTSSSSRACPSSPPAVPAARTYLAWSSLLPRLCFPLRGIATAASPPRPPPPPPSSSSIVLLSKLILLFAMKNHLYHDPHLIPVGTIFAGPQARQARL
jgi:hypothetical protein